MAAVLRVAKLKGDEVAIPEMVFVESLAQRGRDAVEAVEAFTAAVKKMNKMFGPEEVDYYVPNADDAVAIWKDEIASTFHIFDSHHSDAIEALHREANRTPPARATQDSAVRARDALIWLTVKRHHQNQNTQTYFVSSNTRDFANTSGKTGLRLELHNELILTERRIIYCASLERILDEITDSAQPTPLSSSEVSARIADLSPERMIGDALTELHPAQAAGDMVVGIVSTIDAVKEERAFLVEEARLSRIRVGYEMLLIYRQSIAADLLSVKHAGSAIFWLSEGGGQVNLEFDALYPAGTPQIVDWSVAQSTESGAINDLEDGSSEGGTGLS